MVLFNVQKGIPLPEISRAPKSPHRKFPVQGMEPGDMFFVPGKSSKSVSAYISRITKDLPGKYTARHCWMLPVGMRGDQRVWEMATPETDGAEQGVGVWRTE